MPDREQASLDERWRAYEQLSELREHWYWRPGWAPGRSFYTWHLTFAGQAALFDLVGRVQATLDEPGLDPVPPEWLHLTMQGVGFVDEVSDSDLRAIVAAARRLAVRVPPFRLRIGPVDPDEEGVGLLVRPWAPVELVRTAAREAISNVWPTVPEPADGFRPHLTVAYSGAAVPVAPIRERLKALRCLDPVDVTIDQVQLIALRRVDRMYQWDVAATVQLGAASVS